MSDALDSARRGGAVLLAGPLGIGRRHLVAAAAGLSRAGEHTAVIGVDLGDFEPGNDDSYWNVLLATLPSPPDSAPAGGPSPWKRGTEAAAVEAALQALSADRRVLLHLRNATDLPLPVLADLAAAAAGAPGLSLVVSCSPWQFSGLETPFPGEVAAMLHLRPLTRDELASSAERAVHPHRLTAESRERLWELSRGNPVLASRALLAWQTDGLPSAAPATSSRGDDPISVQLDRFLGLAGLCGEYVPADLVLAYQGISSEAADEVLDRIDRDLLAEGDMIFRDLQYSHAAFPAHSIYRFAHPEVAALARSLSEDSPGVLAEGPAFLAFLEERLAARTRGATRVLLSVASAIRALDARSRYLREIDWWIGAPDAAALTQFLAREIGGRQIAAETLWTTCQETAGRWPGYRRLAMLEAYALQPGGVPEDRRGELLWSRAAILLEMGRSGEAHGDAVQALTLLERQAGPGDPRVAGCRAVLGAVLRDLGDLPGARHELEAALDAARGFGREGAPLQLTILHILAETLRDLGELELARRTLEEGVACASELESDRRKISFFLKHLAKVFRSTGEYREAGRVLEEALRLDRLVFGERSPELTVPLRNLADVRLALGDKEAARRVLAEALSIQEATGVAGPEVVVLRNTLIEVLLDLGEDGAARRELEAALVTLRRAGDRGADDCRRESVLLRRLGELACRQRDFAAARGFFENALEAEEALPESEPAQATILKNLGDVFLALQDGDGAVGCLRRVQQIEERLFGAGDPRVAPNIKYLTALLERLGRSAEAADLPRSQPSGRR